MKANNGGLNAPCKNKAKETGKGLPGSGGISHSCAPGAADLKNAEEALMKEAMEALSEQMRLQAQKMAEELARQKPACPHPPAELNGHKGRENMPRARGAARFKKAYGWKSIAVRTILLLSLMAFCSAYVAGVRSISQLGEKIAQKAFAFAIYSEEPVRSMLLFVGKIAGGKPAPGWAEDSGGNFAAETSKQKNEMGRKKETAPAKESSGID